MRGTLPIVFLVLAFIAPPVSAYHAGRSESRHTSAEATRRFKSYDEAIRYVRSYYAGESINTSRSSWITSAEYFYADGRVYLILGMKGRPYLFAGVPRDVWE